MSKEIQTRGLNMSRNTLKNKKNVGCHSLWFYKIILCFDFDGVGFIMLLQMLHSCMSFENLEYNIGKEREFCVDIDKYIR